MRGSERPQSGDGLRGEAVVPDAGRAEPSGDGVDGEAVVPDAGRAEPSGEAVTDKPAPSDGPGAGSGDAPEPGRAEPGGDEPVGSFSPVDAGRCAGMPEPEAPQPAAEPGPTSQALRGADDRLAAIRQALAGLRDLPLWTVGQRELLSFTRDVEATLRSGYGIQVRLAGELDQRGVADMLDARTAGHLLHITMADARGRVAAATTTLPRDTPTGAPIDPPAPLRREQALGEIAHRHLTAGAGPRDGGVRPQVVLTINLDDLIDALRRHHTADHTAGTAATGEGSGSAAGADRGTRSGADVAGSGSAATSNSTAGTGDEFGGWTIPDGWTPDQGWAQPAQPARSDSPAAGTRWGGPAWTDYDGTHTGSDPRRGGPAWTDYDGTQHAAMARLLACDAAIIPQILGGDSAVLDQGRAVRLFTPEQRRAITTRDKGCAFPACDTPPAWTQAHHITWWSHGGPPTPATACCYAAATTS